MAAPLLALAPELALPSVSPFSPFPSIDRRSQSPFITSEALVHLQRLERWDGGAGAAPPPPTRQTHIALETTLFWWGVRRQTRRLAKPRLSGSHAHASSYPGYPCCQCGTGQCGIELDPHLWSPETEWAAAGDLEVTCNTEERSFRMVKGLSVVTLVLSVLFALYLRVDYSLFVWLPLFVCF